MISSKRMEECIVISSDDEDPEHDCTVVISSDDESSTKPGIHPPKSSRNRRQRQRLLLRDSGVVGKTDRYSTSSETESESSDMSEAETQVRHVSSSQDADLLFEHQTEFAKQLSLLETEPLLDRYLNMGQSDDPPAKKRKWNWSDDVSPAEDVKPAIRRTKCLSEISNNGKYKTQLRKRQDYSSAKSFDDVVNDELPDLAEIEKVEETIHKKHKKPHRHKDSSYKQRRDCLNKIGRSESEHRKHKHDRHHHHRKRDHSGSLKSQHRKHSHRSDDKAKINLLDFKNSRRCLSPDRLLERFKKGLTLSPDLEEKTFEHEDSTLMESNFRSDEPQEISTPTKSMGKDCDSKTLPFCTKRKDCDDCDTCTCSSSPVDMVESGTGEDEKSQDLDSVPPLKSSTTGGSKLKFCISEEHRKRFAAVLLRSKRDSSSNTKDSSAQEDKHLNNFCRCPPKKIRRASADTTNTSAIHQSQDSDSSSLFNDDASSVSSRSGRHFLDALSACSDNADRASICSSLCEEGAPSLPVEEVDEIEETEEIHATGVVAPVEEQEEHCVESENQTRSKQNEKGLVLPKTESVPGEVQEFEDAGWPGRPEDTVVEVKVEPCPVSVLKVEPGLQSSEDDVDSEIEVKEEPVDSRSDLVLPENDVDSDFLPDLDEAVSVNIYSYDLFEDEDNVATPLSTYGDIVNATPSHPILKGYLNLRETFAFTEMHCNSILANFEEGHEQNAMCLMHDFTTSVRKPTKELVETVIENILLGDLGDNTQLKLQGYNLLVYVSHLHPPDRKVSFSYSILVDIMDKVKDILNCKVEMSTNDANIIGLKLAMQFCVVSLESELMNRKLGSLRDIAKSSIARWFSLETCFSRVETLITWLKLAEDFDKFVRTRDHDSNHVLGFQQSLHSELQKLLSLVVAASSLPLSHCSRVGHCLSCLVSQLEDEEVKVRTVESIANPLLQKKTVEGLLESNVDVDWLEMCFGQDDISALSFRVESSLQRVAQYLLALAKTEQEKHDLPLHARILEGRKPRQSTTLTLLWTFLDKVKVMREKHPSLDTLEDDVHLAQLECQLEALEL